MDSNEKLKYRECPHCHKLISRKNCSFYLLKGSKYPITCNHCGKEVQPSGEAWPFRVGFFIGFAAVVISMKYFLYLNYSFLDSLKKSIPFILLGFLLSGIITVEFIRFRKED